MTGVGRNPVAALLRKYGEVVILRRPVQGKPPAQWPQAIVKGRVRNYDASQLTGEIRQGDYEVIVAESDLRDEGFPFPPRSGDRVILLATLTNGTWDGASGLVTTVQHPGYRGHGTGFWMHTRGDQ